MAFFVIIATRTLGGSRETRRKFKLSKASVRVFYWEGVREMKQDKRVEVYVRVSTKDQSVDMQKTKKEFLKLGDE